MTSGQLRIEQIDSDILGRPVLFLDLADEAILASLPEVEAAYLDAQKPAYVWAKVPVEALPTVHALERSGFSVVETQLRCSASTRVKPSPDLGLRLRRADTPELLAAAQDLASDAFAHDRFSNDPVLPRHFAGERYRRFLAKSAMAPNERVYVLTQGFEGPVLGFKSHRIEPADPARATLLLGAVKAEYVGLGFGAVSGHLEFAALAHEGVREVVTHYPARNYAIINLELRGLGFRLVAAFYILRKWYPLVA